MKSQYALANTLAVTVAILFVMCRILVGIFPDASFAIAQSWFHGIEISKSGIWNLSLSSFVLGLVSITISSWVVGFIFTKVSKLFSK